jgi:hypothetical protein
MVNEQAFMWTATYIRSYLRITNPTQYLGGDPGISYHYS